MHNSESPSRVSSETATPPDTLADVQVGARVTIREVVGPDAAALRQEGLMPGASVTVERRMGFGGPIILALGSVRLAVARHALRDVIVEPTR